MGRPDHRLGGHDLSEPPVHSHSRWGVPPINGRCLDISKTHVDAAKAKVFGYSLDIDPTTYVGMCVEKSNENARHDVEILECPVATPVPDRVYQRFVDTLQPEGYFEDIRIAVIGNEVPVCWRRIKSGDGLAEKLNQHYDRSIPVPAAELLSADEVTLILKLSSELGLDFAEYDAGRDRSDGRLYIYDANSTPIVRNTSSTDEEKALAIRLLAAAFARQFQPLITFEGPE